MSDHFPLVETLRWRAAPDEPTDADEDVDDVASRLDAIERQIAELLEEVSRLRELVEDGE